MKSNLEVESFILELNLVIWLKSLDSDGPRVFAGWTFAGLASEIGPLPGWAFAGRTFAGWTFAGLTFLLKEELWQAFLPLKAHSHMVTTISNVKKNHFYFQN